MSKGSKRRLGDGFSKGWDVIFAKDKDVVLTYRDCKVKMVPEDENLVSITHDETNLSKVYKRNERLDFKKEVEREIDLLLDQEMFHAILLDLKQRQSQADEAAESSIS